MLDLYVTSPQKGEGKTFITAGLAATIQSLGYKTSVYKPIQTGGIEVNGFAQSPDLTFVKTIDPYINTQFTYLFKKNAEPLIASEDEDTVIDLDLIIKDFSKMHIQSDCVLVDGDGALMTPLAPQLQNFDIIASLQIPVLYTLTLREGEINDILLSINMAQQKGIKVNGVVINRLRDGFQNAKLTNLIRIIEEYTDIKVLGILPELVSHTQPDEIITNILNGIDIESVFNVKIEKLDFN